MIVKISVVCLQPPDQPESLPVSAVNTARSHSTR